jgi:hypothetical protein
VIQSCIYKQCNVEVLHEGMTPILVTCKFKSAAPNSWEYLAIVQRCKGISFSAHPLAVTIMVHQ